MKALVHMNEEDMKSLGIPMVLHKLNLIHCFIVQLLEACSLSPKMCLKTLNYVATIRNLSP